MLDQLKQLQTEALAAFTAAQNLPDLEAARVAYLGRKGRLSEILPELAHLSNDEKRLVGQTANEVKAAIEGAFIAAQARIESAHASLNAERAWIDMSLPGNPPSVGHTHLTSQAIEDIMAIFSKLGFNRQRHPEAVSSIRSSRSLGAA